MLEFMNMMGNYEERKVALNEFSWGMVSTVGVTDGKQSFETAVQCNLYKDFESRLENGMCIVESYDSKKDAFYGHCQWVFKMTSKPLPKELIDCGNSEIGQLVDIAMGHKTVFKLIGG